MRSFSDTIAAVVLRARRHGGGGATLTVDHRGNRSSLFFFSHTGVHTVFELVPSQADARRLPHASQVRPLRSVVQHGHVAVQTQTVLRVHQRVADVRQQQLRRRRHPAATAAATAAAAASAAAATAAAVAATATFDRGHQQHAVVLAIQRPAAAAAAAVLHGVSRGQVPNGVSAAPACPSVLFPVGQRVATAATAASAAAVVTVPVTVRRRCRRRRSRQPVRPVRGQVQRARRATVVATDGGRRSLQTSGRGTAGRRLSDARQEDAATVAVAVAVGIGGRTSPSRSRPASAAPADGRQQNVAVGR